MGWADFEAPRNVNFRLIARLDIKGPNVIKGIHLEGLRVVGNPHELATRYYEQGIHEILYMDAVASLYGRDAITSIIKEASRSIFVPMTVGGGIRSVDDAMELLRAGADKVAVNSAAVANPSLISDLAKKIGSQSVVLSIEAKRNGSGWEAYTDGGRHHSGLDVVEWAQRGWKLGAGEILVTSVDADGAKRGCDLALLKAVVRSVPIPVIASGGVGNANHVSEARKMGVSAVAVGSALHYGMSVGDCASP